MVEQDFINYHLQVNQSHVDLRLAPVADRGHLSYAEL